VYVNNILRYVEARIAYVCLSFLKKTPPSVELQGCNSADLNVAEARAQHGLYTGGVINYELPL
jgi:hypothetical protein